MSFPSPLPARSAGGWGGLERGSGKSAQTVGRAIMKQGDSIITINTPAVTESSLIHLTFLDDLAGRTWYVSERTAGEHFTIKFSGNLAYDIEFQWWLLDSDEDGTAIQYSSEPVAPAEEGYPIAPLPASPAGGQDDSGSEEEPIVEPTPTSTASTTP